MIGYHMFQDAEEEVYAAMERGSFLRFKRSRLFEEFLLECIKQSGKSFAGDGTGIK